MQGEVARGAEESRDAHVGEADEENERGGEEQRLHALLPRILAGGMQDGRTHRHADGLIRVPDIEAANDAEGESRKPFLGKLGRARASVRRHLTLTVEAAAVEGAHRGGRGHGGHASFFRLILDILGVVGILDGTDFGRQTLTHGVRGAHRLWQERRGASSRYGLMHSTD